MNITDSDDGALGMTHLYFGWLDFTIFGLMLGSSALIGVYFGFCDKKQESRVDYLFGGKTMTTLPVAVSLVARLVPRCV
jgi:Na+/proline symporter